MISAAFTLLSLASLESLSPIQSKDSKNVRVAMDKMRQQTTLAHVNAEKGLMMFHRGLKTRFISHGLFWCLYGFT